MRPVWLPRFEFELFLLLAAFFVWTGPAWGAACCASSGVFPSLISGEERVQLTLSGAALQVVGDASQAGQVIGRGADDDEVRQTLKLDAVALLSTVVPNSLAPYVSDRWQMGVSIPTLRRARGLGENSAESTGVGDVALTLGYEVLPLWEYSAWRPKGYWFLQLGIPTGTSLQQAAALYRVDVTGRGFFNLSTGGYLLKTIRAWDVTVLGEVHRPLPRTMETDFGSFSLRPGWGASAAVAVGYSPGNGPLRLGAMVAPSYEGALVTTGAIEQTAGSQMQWTSSLQLGYLVSPEWTLSANYTDQTWLGRSSNVALNRGFGFLVQKRWDR